MAKLTKRQKAIAEKIEAGKAYNFEEAATLLASLPAALLVKLKAQLPSCSAACLLRQ